jgi:geranylgeranylglycerol-phosphate geranylgeranyltransferase
MAINDYFDREIDAVNEPSRPIPSGDVKSVEAIVYSFLLSLVGLSTAYLTGFASLGVAVFSWLVMMVYSMWGKRTGFLGNLMVSTCIALPFIYGGIIAGNVSAPLLFSALAFLSNTGREVTKGIVDTEGDGARGVRTIAVAYGVDKAAYLDFDTPSYSKTCLQLVHTFRGGDRRRTCLQRRDSDAGS